MPDGRLWLIRGTHAAETAWAPRHVGKELRLVRLGAFDAGLGAIRADAEAIAARKAGDYDGHATGTVSPPAALLVDSLRCPMTR